MLWQGAYNRQVYLGDRTLTEGFQSIGQSYGQAYELLLNRWTPENAETATLPRLSAGGNGYNHQYSSLWMKSGNFFRLKNIHLAYNLPPSFSRRYLGGARVKLFVNGQNLFTKSAINWVDPEVSFTSAPLQRCVSTGINLKF
jgi:TonB dependent receptor.